SGARFYSSRRNRKDAKAGDDDWNVAWETAWLPDDLSGKGPRAPWETDVAFPSPSHGNNPTELPMDAETQAFVEEMNDNWEQRKGKSAKKEAPNDTETATPALYSLENIKKDYRLTKQRIHAGLWVKEIEKLEEAKLGEAISGAHDDDIDKFLDSASEIFDSGNNELKAAGSSSELKNKPDGWEATSKSSDGGSIWDMSRREEDVLVQEYERRIAFNKFQIASFIKTHIFSRRRPIDGWKYMIEEIGPNSRKTKGSVSRTPSVSDESTQPFREEKTP
ncbi:hypothetical protein M569_01239, partial [Genlisea aurea]